AKATAAATVSETFAATSAVTQGTPVLSASGVLLFTGTAASTQAPASLSATAFTGMFAVIASTQAAASLAASLATEDAVIPPQYWRGAEWAGHPLVNYPIDGALR